MKLIILQWQWQLEFVEVAVAGQTGCKDPFLPLLTDKYQTLNCKPTGGQKAKHLLSLHKSCVVNRNPHSNCKNTNNKITKVY